MALTDEGSPAIPKNRARMNGKTRRGGDAGVVAGVSLVVVDGLPVAEMCIRDRDVVAMESLAKAGNAELSWAGGELHQH